MKQILFMNIALWLALPVWGQAAGESRLSGVVKGMSGQPTVVCSLTSTSQADTLEVAADGSFAKSYALDKATEAYLYVSGAGVEQASFCLYLKPGASIRVEVEQQDGALHPSYLGDTGAESAYRNLHRNMCTMGSTFSQEAWLSLPHFAACKQYVADKQQLLREALHRVQDRAFVQAEEKQLQEGLPTYYFGYAMAKQQAGTRMENDVDFMAYTQTIDVNDTAQVTLTSAYLDWYVIAHPLPGLADVAAKLRHANTLVTNPTVKNRLAESAVMLLAFAGMFGADTSEMALSVYPEILRLSTDEALCARIRSELKTLEYQQPGAEVADLQMEDAQGRAYSLKEVVGKGRYTYIDFWATWCAPCRKEIPALEQLVQEYGTDAPVRFVSISLDEKREAWLRQLTTDKPAWEQYNIPKANQHACAEYYGISGIPRFMLFDKEGRMMQASASRPSDPETKKLLNKLIKGIEQ